MSLDELVELSPVEAEAKVKNAFVIRTAAAKITLQASTQLDAQDWSALLPTAVGEKRDKESDGSRVTAIKRQLRRKRSSGGSSLGGSGGRRLDEEVELERELESLHMVLFANADLMHQWKCCASSSPLLGRRLKGMPFEASWRGPPVRTRSRRPSRGPSRPSWRRGVPGWGRRAWRAS